MPHPQVLLYRVLVRTGMLHVVSVLRQHPLLELPKLKEAAEQLFWHLRRGAASVLASLPTEE